jgi:hypothetical protein
MCAQPGPSSPSTLREPQGARTGPTSENREASCYSRHSGASRQGSHCHQVVILTIQEAGVQTFRQRQDSEQPGKGALPNSLPMRGLLQYLWVGSRSASISLTASAALTGYRLTCKNRCGHGCGPACTQSALPFPFEGEKGACLNNPKYSGPTPQCPLGVGSRSSVKA